MRLPQRQLTRQYRMHPAIREFPSTTFYGGRLVEDDQAPPDTRVPMPRSEQNKAPLSWWPFQQVGSKHEFPVAFLDVQGTERKGAGSDTSFDNPEEASLALRLLLLFATDSTVRSIIILSPYASQVQMLNSLLRNGRDVITRLRNEGHFHLTTYGAYSVDGFQGQEADVIIMTTVRSNSGGRTLGFLADARRLNVGITRAKRALLVVGHAASLQSVSKETIDKGAGDVKNYWPEWLDWVRRKGGFIRQTEVEPKYMRTWVVLEPAMQVTGADKQQYEKLQLYVKALHAGTAKHPSHQKYLRQ